ncbi:MAG TPA: DUF5668 domain-containing protein [Lentimicrobium sp.]|nr:DUF5668 domain-containing protein [Lentimicrobium sp.]
MSYKKLFWGILLVIIGILFILKNMGLIFFDWWTIVRLWPLILILWGVSLIPVQGYIKLILSLVAIAVTVVLVTQFDRNERPFGKWHRDHSKWEYKWDHNDNDTAWSNEVQELFQTYDSTMKEATLTFDAAAGDFKLSDSLLTDKLILFKKRGNIGDYSMTSTDEEGRRIVNLSIEDSDIKLNNRGNMVQLYLNPQPVWDFKFEVGAASIDFDLSNFNIATLGLEGGASSMNLKLGNKNPMSKVNIEAGAASIDIAVPTAAGVEINTETVLTSHNFPGFKKISKGQFRTDNYNTASSRIIIDVDAGVSSLAVTRY